MREELYTTGRKELSLRMKVVVRERRPVPQDGEPLARLRWVRSAIGVEEVCDVVHLPAQKLCVAPPEEPLGRGVHEGHEALRVDGEEALSHVHHHGLALGLPLTRRPGSGLRLVPGPPHRMHQHQDHATHEQIGERRDHVAAFGGDERHVAPEIEVIDHEEAQQVGD